MFRSRKRGMVPKALQPYSQEAKHDALESIVKKQPKTNAPGQLNRRRKGSLQMSLNGLQNGSLKLDGNQEAAYAEKTLKQKI